MSIRYIDISVAVYNETCVGHGGLMKFLLSFLDCKLDFHFFGYTKKTYFEMESVFFLLYKIQVCEQKKHYTQLLNIFCVVIKRFILL